MSDDMISLDDLRREICRFLAFHEDADRFLKVTDDKGGHPVIVALENEPISALARRVAVVGGIANVFVHHGDGRLSYVSVIDEVRESIVSDNDAPALKEAPYPLSTVGIFLEYLRTKPNGVMTAIAALGRNAQAGNAESLQFQSS